MYMRRAPSMFHGLVCEKLLELSGQKFACVVGMKCADDACRLAPSLICNRFELGNERSNSRQRLVLRMQKIYLLPSGVVIDEYEKVLMLAVY